MDIQYTTNQKTAPAIEPITVAEVKSQARYTDTDEDSYITDDLIPAARQLFETMTGRQLIAATWELFLDEFPQTIYLPYPPAEKPVGVVTCVNSVKYYDIGGTLQTLAAANYQIDSFSEPARIKPAYGEAWPAARAQSNAIVVEYDAGYGAAASDVPVVIRRALISLAAHWFVSRDPTVTERGVVTAEIPFHLRTIIDSYNARKLY